MLELAMLVAFIAGFCFYRWVLRPRLSPDE